MDRLHAIIYAVDANLIGRCTDDGTISLMSEVYGSVCPSLVPLPYDP